MVSWKLRSLTLIFKSFTFLWTLFCYINWSSSSSFCLLSLSFSCWRIRYFYLYLTCSKLSRRSDVIGILVLPLTSLLSNLLGLTFLLLVLISSSFTVGSYNSKLVVVTSSKKCFESSDTSLAMNYGIGDALFIRFSRSSNVECILDLSSSIFWSPVMSYDRSPFSCVIYYYYLL